MYLVQNRQSRLGARALLVSVKRCRSSGPRDVRNAYGSDMPIDGAEIGNDFVLPIS